MSSPSLSSLLHELAVEYRCLCEGKNRAKRQAEEEKRKAEEAKGCQSQ